MLPTASIGKILLLIEVSARLTERDVSGYGILDKTPRDAVGDSGIWQHLQAPSLPVADLATLVGATSDNLATNVLLRQVGLQAVRARTESLGLLRTALLDLVRDSRGPDDAPQLSVGSTAELSWLFGALARGEVVDTLTSQRVLGWLSLNSDLSMVASAFGLDPLSHRGADHGTAAGEQDRHRLRACAPRRACCAGRAPAVAYAVSVQFNDSGIAGAAARARRHAHRRASTCSSTCTEVLTRCLNPLLSPDSLSTGDPHTGVGNLGDVVISLCPREHTRTARSHPHGSEPAREASSPTSHTPYPLSARAPPTRVPVPRPVHPDAPARRSARGCREPACPAPPCSPPLSKESPEHVQENPRRRRSPPSSPWAWWPSWPVRPAPTTTPSTSSVTCATDGAYKVTWSVTNSESNKTEVITASSNAAVVPVGTSFGFSETKKFVQTVTEPQNLELDLTRLLGRRHVDTATTCTPATAAGSARTRSRPAASRSRRPRRPQPSVCDGPNHFTDPTYTIDDVTGVAVHRRRRRHGRRRLPGHQRRPAVHIEASVTDAKYKIVGTAAWDFTFTAPEPGLHGRGRPGDARLQAAGLHRPRRRTRSRSTSSRPPPACSTRSRSTAAPSSRRLRAWHDVPEGVTAVQIIARGDTANYYVLKGGTEDLRLHRQPGRHRAWSRSSP